MKRIAITQSNYIPWKGYFDMMASADEFILYDDVQYTKSDWRNRNIIKVGNKTQWLTIPVEHHIDSLIKDVKTTQKNWATKHWKTLSQCYSKASAFAELNPLISHWYATATDQSLSDINLFFLTRIKEYLGITTLLTPSSMYQYAGDRSERLVSLCKSAGATVYISGPSAKAYLDEHLFKQSGITVEWMDYSGYPEYPQLGDGFVHGVTILDLLFNCGKDAKKYMKCGQM